MKLLFASLLGISLLLHTGCSKPEAKAQGKDEHGHADGDAAHKDPPAKGADPSRIALPDNVRQNLGVTFAKAQKRHVSCALRLPGRFELLPTAKREYHAVLPGRVDILVRQYDKVEAGAVLFRIESPEWIKLRQQLQDEQTAIKKTAAEVDVAGATKAEAEQAAALLHKRIETLAGVEVRRVELEGQLAERRASLPRLEAELRVKKADHESAVQRFPLTLASAASILGTTVEKLLESAGPKESPVPRWRTISSIEVRAADAGLVDTLHMTSGAWAEVAKPVVTTLNPGALRFRAVGLQADLGKLCDGLTAAIAPPAGSRLESAPRLPGTLSLVPEGNPDSRTIELIVTPKQLDGWARAGVSAFLEVITDANDEEELAIPVAAVVQDELSHVFFRRDPKDPDTVIRVEADLGISDGQWVVVNSGLKSGDEVVVHGVYELKLASSGKGSTGGKGHFHADGAYCEDKDKK